jgi:hypothetical protein
MRWDFDAAALVGAAAAATCVFCAPGAGAEGNAIDSSYGRVDGDVSVIAGLGGVVAPRGLRAAGELRVRYLETAGLFATYDDAEVWGSASEPRRSIAMGIELRPLFLFRWLQGHELQRPWIDLTVDSLGLELGAVFAQPAGASFGSRRGLEVGFGIELPILPHASGPWIGVHGALRWSDDAIASWVVRGPDDRQAVLALTVAWHQTLGAHLVDAKDRRIR